jgi:hypothetical protein
MAPDIIHFADPSTGYRFIELQHRDKANLAWRVGGIFGNLACTDKLEWIDGLPDGVPQSLHNPALVVMGLEACIQAERLFFCVSPAGDNMGVMGYRDGVLWSAWRSLGPGTKRSLVAGVPVIKHVVKSLGASSNLILRENTFFIAYLTRLGAKFEDHPTLDNYFIFTILPKKG